MHEQVWEVAVERGTYRSVESNTCDNVRPEGCCTVRPCANEFYQSICGKQTTHAERPKVHQVQAKGMAKPYLCPHKATLAFPAPPLEPLATSLRTMRSVSQSAKRTTASFLCSVSQCATSRSVS